MRFVLRSLIGLACLAGAVGAVGYGWISMQAAIAARDEPAPRRVATERVFAVEVGRVDIGEAVPVVEAFGEIRSWRTLELRAASGGRLVELADGFRDGARVGEGDLLFRIDPKDFAAGVEDAAAALEEAEADLSEARQSVEAARREREAAETQRDLRQAALDRRAGLLSRGVSTSAEVEDAALALAAAEQAAAGRAQALLTATMRIQRTELSRRRAAIALGEARRDLAETEHRADFPGLLGDVTAVLGGLVSPNERLGVLIDPSALEAVFRVTNAQYARLLDETGALKPIPLTVSLDLDETPLTVAGVLDRASAVIEEGETGRLVYARLDLGAATLLRPGDFVSVRIEEPRLSAVATLPASAVTEGGELLVLDETGRLRAAEVRILRRQADDVIVAGAPDGARYVKVRAPQLGAGIKVRPLGEDPAPDRNSGAGGDALAAAAAATPASAQSGAAQEMTLVDIGPDMQARLIGFVEASDKMSAEMKVRVLSTLRSGRAPAQMLERIERRMDDAG